MAKEQYKGPEIKVVTLETYEPLATSVNSTGTGIRFGGNASDYQNIIEADANRQNGWNLW